MEIKIPLAEDTSRPSNQSSDPICSYGLCDGSGMIYLENGDYQHSKFCQCLKDRSKIKFLGERFYKVNLADVQPRNPKQERLKALLIKSPETGVFLYGRGNTGKTHFLAAMYNYWESKNKRLKYLEDSILKDELRNAELNNDYAFASDLVNNNDCIFIDDVGKAAMSTFHQSALYRVFNEAYKRHKYIFITSNDTLQALGANEYWGAHVARRAEDLCQLVEF